MSAIAPARKASVLPPTLSPRTPPQHKATGLPRPRLVLVSQRQRTVAGRLPFVILVGAVLAGGLVAVLLLHMVAAQDGFRASALAQRLQSLTNQEQDLQQKVDADSAPGALQKQATDLGMVPSSVSSFQHRPDGRAIGTQTGVTPPAPITPATTKPATTKAATSKAATSKTTSKVATTTGKTAAKTTTTTTTTGTTGTTPKPGKSGTPKPGTTGTTPKAGKTGGGGAGKAPTHHTASR
jgi:hypothetical protein